LFGYTYDEVVGKDLDDFVANHESIHQEAKRNTKQVINEGQVRSTCKRTRKDGSFVDVELLALPIVVAEEKIGFIAIYHDLTEIKLIERELRKKNDKMSRELALAGEIQKSFLPHNLPNIKGWQISSSLKSASETSGDFYDIRKLPNGNLSILIADVIDKGVGAALFMSLCWSLFRIFSDRFETKPQRVFSEINRRILTDTKSGQFVTVFYGVLDPQTGEFIYCSAGHTPTYIIKNNKSKDYLRLTHTGMPIGIEKNEKWDQNTAVLEDGDFMVLYTDGIIEGENQEGDFYGENRLRKVLQENSGRSAKEINNLILEDLHLFLGNRPQSDDIALIVIKRAD
jgi:sigma-B regulation protein RsbU (phosphoserine phosphatase)